MADSRLLAQRLTASAAVAVLVSRARDLRYLPRLLLLESSAPPSEAVRLWAATLSIFSFEKAVSALLRRMGWVRMPSTLASMMLLFTMLKGTQWLGGRQLADEIARLLQPGVDFLGKWLGLALAPPLSSLDTSLAALPHYPPAVWGKVLLLLCGSWATTHIATGRLAATLAPSKCAVKAPSTAALKASVKVATAESKESSRGDDIAPDEAVRRAWVVVGALSFLGVSCSSSLPVLFHRPLRMMAELSASVCGLVFAKILPVHMQRFLQPVVVCAATTNFALRCLGPSAPFFGLGLGVGDLLFQWLPAGVTCLGVRMYATSNLWLDDRRNFCCLVASCGASATFSMLFTLLTAVNPVSPFSLPAPLSLPLINRSVTSAIGIAGSHAIGPECDPKLSVACILITGCLGASLGPYLLPSSEPMVRGASMGSCSHAIGTSALLALGEDESAAISGAAMCLTGAAHTLLLQIPGVIPRIRTLARV